VPPPPPESPPQAAKRVIAIAQITMIANNFFIVLPP